MRSVFLAVFAVCTVSCFHIAQGLADCSPPLDARNGDIVTLTNTELKCQWIIRPGFHIWDKGVALNILKSYFLGEMKVYRLNSDERNTTNTTLVMDYLYHIHNDTYLTSIYGFLIVANMTIPTYGKLKFTYTSYEAVDHAIMCIGLDSKYFCKMSEMCIPSARRCDQIKHCLHGDDEIDCDKPDCDPYREKECDGKCISFLDTCGSSYVPQPTPSYPDEHPRSEPSGESTSGVSVGLSVGVVIFVVVCVVACRFMRHQHIMKQHARSQARPAPYPAAPMANVQPNTMSGYVPSNPHDNPAFQANYTQNYGVSFSTVDGLSPQFLPPTMPTPTAPAPPSYDDTTKHSPPSYNEAVTGYPTIGFTNENRG